MKFSVSIFAEGDFVEVFVDTPVEVCISRDPKGLYKKARAGVIKNFTGIDSSYEAPVEPELLVDAGVLSVEECAKMIYEYLSGHGYI